MESFLEKYFVEKRGIFAEQQVSWALTEINNFIVSLYLKAMWSRSITIFRQRSK